MTQFKKSTLHPTPLLISSFLLLGAAFINELPYQYFSLLRLFVSVTCVYAIYNSFKAGSNSWGWVYVFILMIFNPIVPFTFSKFNWILIDKIVAIIFLIASYWNLILSLRILQISWELLKYLAIISVGTSIVVGLFWVVWQNIEHTKAQESLTGIEKNTPKGIPLGFELEDQLVQTNKVNVGVRKIESSQEARGEKFDYNFLRLAQGTSPTGFNWLKMTKEEKKFYLMGYEDGNLNALAFNVKDQRIRDEALGRLPSFIGGKEDAQGFLISKLDEYYGQHMAYKVFPVPLVISIIVNKVLVITDEVINEQFRFHEQELDKIVGESSEEDAGFAK